MLLVRLIYPFKLNLIYRFFDLYRLYFRLHYKYSINFNLKMLLIFIHIHQGLGVEGVPIKLTEFIKKDYVLPIVN